MRSRQAIPIETQDQRRLITALEAYPQKEGFVGYRTRAFVYLLWDGALRTGSAIWLNMEEVVKDPHASRIQVVQEAMWRSCEANRYRARPVFMSDRAREAIADYLKVARSDGWLADKSSLEGPLWIASQPKGEQTRMSQRTAMQAWRTFLDGVRNLSNEYQLDDVVFTGRIAFIRQARGSTDLISQHAGISAQWAARYSDHVRSDSNIREVMTELNRQRKRKS
jgi:hypothetical protein